MTILSGILGVVEGKSAVAKWNVSHTADLQEIVASNTQGMTVTLKGNKDWTGSYEAYGAELTSLPGQSLAFAGSIDGTVGVQGDVIIDNIVVTFNIEGGLPIKYVVNFSANSDLTIGADVVADDTTLAGMPSSVGVTVELGTSADPPISYVAISDVRTVTITITADNKSFVSSSTSGSTRRLAGNLKAEVAVTVYEDDFADLPILNAYHGLKVILPNAEFWEFIWVQVMAATDLEVNRETAEPVGATLNFKFSGFQEVIAGTMADGKIDAPGESNFWSGAP
ncbi:hypothetical protein LCGC14_0357500 [marine sediment metagenome]|uniref:Uncharacterized protein n=1 Tax=marine sediment metagenome TaxID=412755 RepID=A0A0F9VWF0_9ZZZZ